MPCHAVPWYGMTRFTLLQSPLDPAQVNVEFRDGRGKIQLVCVAFKGEGWATEFLSAARQKRLVVELPTDKVLIV